MKTIGWLLSKMILLRFVMILTGISVFVVSLTVVTYSEEILKAWVGRGFTHSRIRVVAVAGNSFNLHGHFRIAGHPAGAC